MSICTECNLPIAEFDERIVDENLPTERIVCDFCLTELESDGTLTRCEECGNVFSPLYLNFNPETNEIELCPYCNKVFCP